MFGVLTPTESVSDWCEQQQKKSQYHLKNTALAKVCNVYDKLL